MSPSFSSTLFPIFPLLFLVLSDPYIPSSRPATCAHFVLPPQLYPARPLTPRFIAFIAGSFAAVLLSASLIDPDLFLHFEITPHRTVLFYLGIFGTILAVSRGMVPEENLVFDPEATLKEVVWWTHYLPAGWKGRLHSKMVRLPFSFPYFLLPPSLLLHFPSHQINLDSLNPCLRSLPDLSHFFLVYHRLPRLVWIPP